MMMTKMMMMMMMMMMMLKLIVNIKKDNIYRMITNDTNDNDGNK